MVRQEIRPRILEKIGEELETEERKAIGRKKNGNNQERRRN